jgi:glycosyl-4,4'-diaponeurosporenoate acyltransferase
MLLTAPVFCLWNPTWAFLILLTYGLLANLPCIATQRYNRARLLALRG